MKSSFCCCDDRSDRSRAFCCLCRFSAACCLRSFCLSSKLIGLDDELAEDNEEAGASFADVEAADDLEVVEAFGRLLEVADAEPPLVRLPLGAERPLPTLARFCAIASRRRRSSSFCFRASSISFFRIRSSAASFVETCLCEPDLVAAALAELPADGAGLTPAAVLVGVELLAAFFTSPARTWVLSEIRSFKVGVDEPLRVVWLGVDLEAGEAVALEVAVGLVVSDPFAVSYRGRTLGLGGGRRSSWISRARSVGGAVAPSNLGLLSPRSSVFLSVAVSDDLVFGSACTAGLGGGRRSSWMSRARSDAPVIAGFASLLSADLLPSAGLACSSFAPSLGLSRMPFVDCDVDRDDDSAEELELLDRNSSPALDLRSVVFSLRSPDEPDIDEEEAIDDRESLRLASPFDRE
jgi:hypothetical protein